MSTIITSLLGASVGGALLGGIAGGAIGYTKSSSIKWIDYMAKLKVIGKYALIGLIVGLALCLTLVLVFQLVTSSFAAAKKSGIAGDALKAGGAALLL